jgi:hypothetical protein
MASKHTHVTKSTTTVTKPIGHGETRTSTTSVTRTGGNVTTSRRITISKPKKASAKKKATTKGKSKAKAPVKLARPPLGGTWICGPNERLPLCGPVAVANHLLAATGVEASSGAIERLYRAAGGYGDSGVPLEDVIAAAATTGLAGCRLAVWEPDDDGDLLELGLDGDRHAAVDAGDGLVISWGEALALDATVISAWSLTWHGQEAR